MVTQNEKMYEEAARLSSVHAVSTMSNHFALSPRLSKQAGLPNGGWGKVD